ncbi:hypothetical protein ACFL0X_00070 [Nanoarchaeota archaeon]
MVNKKLVEYIKSMQESGFSIGDIRKKVKKKGYSNEDIDDAIEYIISHRTLNPLTENSKTKKKKKSHRGIKIFFIVLGIIFLIGILIVGGLFVYYNFFQEKHYSMYRHDLREGESFVFINYGNIYNLSLVYYNELTHLVKIELESTPDSPYQMTKIVEMLNLSFPLKYPHYEHYFGNYRHYNLDNVGGEDVTIRFTERGFGRINIEAEYYDHKKDPESSQFTYERKRRCENVGFNYCSSSNKFNCICKNKDYLFYYHTSANGFVSCCKKGVYDFCSVCENGDSVKECTGNLHLIDGVWYCCDGDCELRDEDDESDEDDEEDDSDKSCSQQNGDLCHTSTGTYTCDGTIVDSQDTSAYYECCVGTCERLPSCGELEGDWCWSDEICDGTLIDSRSSYDCCDGTCISEGGCVDSGGTECRIIDECDSESIEADDTYRCCEGSCSELIPDSIEECEGDIDCFIDAAENCDPASMTYELSFSFPISFFGGPSNEPGMYQEGTTYYELRGTIDGKCIIYHKILNNSIYFTQELIDYFLSMGASQEDIDAQEELSRSSAEAIIGVESACMRTTEELVEIYEGLRDDYIIVSTVGCETYE